MTQIKYGCHVAKTIAMVGSRPNGNQFVIEHEFNAIIYKLISTTDESEPVEIDELLGDPVTK